MAKSPIAAGEEEQDGQATTASPPRTASKVITQQQQQHPSHPRPPLRNFFFFFLPYCAFLIYTSLVSHYTLPTPQTALYDAQTNLPQFSEAKALEYIHHYSEVIGYRILGTPEMDTTIAYTLQVVEQLKAQRTNDNIEFEISHQKGDGHHLFEFMGKKVWKKYLGIENVVVRLSNGTPSGKENAILISAHLDSTLPSPGASDDAAGIAVMLETVRVLSQTPDLLMNTALVFLFNGAEESLQDASHLFITQHEWRHTLRGAINLEACGSAGAETLFQATSSQMLELYSHVPRPMGSIFAPELFATGLLLSDTDFRQFEQYGGLTGLDIAIVKDSYKYHTRLDLVEYIEPGTLQHFGDNVIAMLTAGAAKDPEFFNGIKKARETMYFTVLGGTFLIVAKAGTVTLIYSAISALAVLLAVSTVKKEHRGAYLLAVLNAPATMISGIVMADVAAAVMSIFLGKPLAYFRKEWYCVLLYGGPAVLGMLLPQLILSRVLRDKRYLLTEPNLLEHASLVGQLIFTASAALAGQLAGVLSSYVFALAASSLLLSLVVNDFLLPTIKSRRGPLHSASYYIGQALPLVAGAEGLVSFLDVIVPLTGRTGVDAPSDFIIASLVAGVLYLVLPMLPSLAHRWDTRLLAQAMIGLVFASGMIIAIFAAPSWQPFDAMHPKRLLCLYMENTTSNSFSLHVAGLDPSPLEQIVTSIATEMQLSEKPVHSDISDDIAEWDIIYPVSQFLHSYKVPLPASIVSASSPYKDSFKVEVLDSRLNAVSQTRSLQLAIQHPGIIWTVIAFDADVLKWDLPEPAERGMIRHHVKEASGHNVSTWHLNMELKLSNEQFQAALRQSQRRKGQRKRDAEAEEIDHALGGLRIEFSGLDVSRMWHHKVNEDRKGMEFVESLDKAMPDWVDAMLLTAIAGVAVV